MRLILWTEGAGDGDSKRLRYCLKGPTGRKISIDRPCSHWTLGLGVFWYDVLFYPFV
jgi:hypothetical protein